MRFRRSRALMIGVDNGELLVQNFLTRDRFTCSGECLEFLAKLDNWHTAQEIFTLFPNVDGDDLATQVTELVGMNALVVEGTEQASQEESYRREWQWGPLAGQFHFMVRNTPFLVGKPARKFMQTRKALRPSPLLYQSNRGKKIIKLPRTDVSREPFALMRRRRSERDFDGKPIALSMLSDCLFSGNGVVDFIEDDDYGRLPLTMTPSGGARNPFEMYVYVNAVEGLKPGFYHYAALDHNLGLVRAGRVDVPEMLGGQKWPEDASAIVFLVAHFPRTMWKYHLPMAYRVVMMEAGFISQNIALAATSYGLSAVPSGALKESAIEGYLGNPPIESAVVFSISIGKPNPTRRIRKNKS